MLGQILAIVRNTFFESIRQPIVVVVLVAATIALIFCNLLSGFTMEDDQKMMIDLGLATVFLCGALLAAFIATNVLNREIENKTALTVISKPVGRPLFVLGKFAGVAGALLLATAYMGLVFLLVALHGVLQTVRDPLHVPVLVFGLGAGVLGVGASIWANYFYGRVFASTVIVLTTPLAGLAYLLSLMFDHGFAPQPMSESFNGQLWMALAAIAMAILVLTAIAIAASTRLGQVLTLCVTLGVFLLGMLSDWLLGREIQQWQELWTDRARLEGLTETVTQDRVIELVTGEVERTPVTVELTTVPVTDMAEGGGELAAYWACRVAYAVVPDFQVFWLSDAITQEHVIPAHYLGLTLIYGPLQILMALSVAVILFQRREVG